MSYFDSAYIAKFYLNEPESDAVRRLAESLGHVHCSALGSVEVEGVFHRKWREGAIGQREKVSRFPLCNVIHGATVFNAQGSDHRWSLT